MIETVQAMTQDPATPVLGIMATANVFLTGIAAYFVRNLVADVRTLFKEFQEFKLSIHARVSVLEADSGREPHE